MDRDISEDEKLDASLIKDNAAGDDKNLGEHGENRDYHYSVGDGLRLLIAIRRNNLNYKKIDGSVFTVKAEGEEYSATRENTDHIFIADPLHINNFSKFFNDDIKTITGNHMIDEHGVNQHAKNNQWAHMPTTLILPMLAGMHWYCIRIEINYTERMTSILWDDPYGQRGDYCPLFDQLIPDLKRGVLTLFQTKTNNPALHLDVINFVQLKKRIDQQGYLKNGYDCGAIIFKNVSDYTNRGTTNSDFETSNSEHSYYTISHCENENHEQQMQDVRAEHVMIYQELSGIIMSSDLDERITIIKKALCESREKKRKILGIVNLAQKLNDIELEICFDYILNKRIENKSDLDASYTDYELQEAYRFVKINTDISEARQEINKFYSTEPLSDSLHTSNLPKTLQRSSMQKSNLKKDNSSNFAIDQLTQELQSTLALQNENHSNAITVDTLIQTKKLSNETKGMTMLAQIFKVHLAYQDIYNGRKYKKAGLKQPKGRIRSNPIKALSEKNIRTIKGKLVCGFKKDIQQERITQNKFNAFGLRPDEIELFGCLLDLPFKLQHATNHFVYVSRAERLNSLTEVHRHNPDYKSPFTSKSNLDELGNGGFVFFRMYVDGTNGDQTRYGNTRIIADMTLLREFGWVSLHDQLVPFSNQRRKQTFYEGNRIIFQAKPASIRNMAKAKKSGDAITYTYRESPIENINFFPKDTQKKFDKGISTISETISFTEEVFYGKDILPGIALSLIYRLRQLEHCGYRHLILSKFNSATSLQRIILLGQLVKNFYHIEGKYPVSLFLQYKGMNKQCFFKPYAHTDVSRKKEDRIVIIENPDGDGRLNLDLSVNSTNAALAYYEEKLDKINRQISNLQKHPDKPSCVAELSLIKEQKVEIETKLAYAAGEKLRYFQEIQKVCQIVDLSWLQKRSYEYLQIIFESLLEFLEDETIRIEQLKSLSVQRLKLMTHDTWIDLLTNKDVNWEELEQLTDLELEAMAETNLSDAILDRGSSFDDLLKKFRTDSEQFEWLTCDDITEVALDLAPNISEKFLKFLNDNGDEVDWEFVEGSLCESEQMILRKNLNSDNYFFESDEYEEHEEEYYSDWKNSP